MSVRGRALKIVTSSAAWSSPRIELSNSPSAGIVHGFCAGAYLRVDRRHGGRQMYFVAVVLTILSGLFYAAGQHQIGSFGADVCRYGSAFCDSPVYVLVGAILAALWDQAPVWARSASPSRRPLAQRHRWFCSWRPRRSGSWGDS